MAGVVCLILLLVSWTIVLGSKSAAEKQLELIRQADELIEDLIYIRAATLLEEAAEYNAAYTQTAEDELKKVYLALIDNRGIRRKYTGLLEKQMGRNNASPEVFAEAACYYLSISKVPEALAVLREGIVKTGSDMLAVMYECHRYVYETSRFSYDYAAEPFGSTVQVKTGDLWGISGTDGASFIPCEYDRISTFSGDRAIAMKNGEVFAVDKNNNRIAKLGEKASAFGNLADDRLPVFVSGVWRRAMADLTLGSVEFQQIGTYSGGFAAAKTAGKWGVIDVASNWLISPEYDGIIQDGLGRCYAQNAVFVRSGGIVLLIVGGRQLGDPFEDARPFSAEGYAAVKRNGKWGYIDTDGTVKIGFRFDDALSFGQHLAAVKQGELWGYISMAGHVVIEPVFLEARSFSNGSAPVLSERGWLFISLLEYKRGPSL